MGNAIGQDWPVPIGGADLGNWTHAEIAAECGAAHGKYRREKSERYRQYFASNPELAGGNPLRACDLASALPVGWESLADLIPVSQFHREHLSGNSSQILALGLLGPAAIRRPSLGWLFGSLEPWMPASTDGPFTTQFEKTLTPETLDERPRQTALDFFAESPELVLCIEAKWTESGINPCGCRDPGMGRCSGRILGRQAYWQAAARVFGLGRPEEGTPCPIHAGYQAVRNAAAATALSEGREAAFGLIYDAENPYFRATGRWPGWPVVLQETVSDYGYGKVKFVSASWQELVRNLPAGSEVLNWAAEKHGLTSTASDASARSS
jgi:hypothetical protein